jgi:chaperone required for assembly of F1-ATPase
LPVDQPRASLEALAAHVAGLDEFRLTALHDLVTLSGSLLIGLATADRHLDPDSAWTLSRVDETWQIEHWGDDEDAAEVAGIKRAQFLQADQFWTLSTL